MSSPADLRASLAQFETACQGLLTSARRHEAEQALIDFRKSPHALVLAQYALHESRDHSVLIQAALCLRQVVVERWQTFPTSDRLNAKETLFNMLVDRSQQGHLTKPVLLQTVRVLAIMWKRSWLDAAAPAQAKESLFHRFSALMGGDQPLALRALATYYLTALVEEFSSVKSSQIGVSLEYHHKCKCSFQAAGLLHAFQLAKRVLGECVKGKAPAMDADLQEVLTSGVMLVDTCFRWRFNTSVTDSFNDEALVPTAFCPDKTWSAELTSPPFPRMLVDLLFATRTNVALAPPLRQVLVQTATLKGEVFETDQQRTEFLLEILNAALRLLGSPLAPPIQCVQLPQTFESVDAGGEALQAGASELLDVCMLIATAVRTFGTQPYFTDSRARSFLDSLFTLARLLLEGAAKTSGVHGARAAEESWMMEGFDHLLEALSLLSCDLLQSQQHCRDVQLLRAFGDIFSLYMTCRLTIAKAVGSSLSVNGEDSDVDSEQFEDATKLTSHLALVASMARANFRSALDTLCATAAQLLQTSARNDEWNEQVYWLALISANVCADEGAGEVPEIPLGVQVYMSTQAPDQMVKLLEQLFELLEREAAAVQRDAFDATVSPLVAEKLLYGVARWSRTFLFTGNSLPKELSEKVLSAGVTASGVYLARWGSQPNVIIAALELLLVFVRKPSARTLMRSLPAWKQVFDALEQSLHSPDWSPLSNLASDDHGQLLRVVILSLDPSRADKSNDLLQGFQRLTGTVITRANALDRSTGGQKKWSLDVLRVVALVEGICGSSSTGVLGGWVRDVVITTLNGPLVNIVRRIIPSAYGMSSGADSDGRLIIASTLRLFATALDTHLLTTPEAHAVVLFDCAGKLLKSLAECNALQQKRLAFVGRRNRVDEEEEDAWAQDVLCMLKILSSLTERDLIDFSDGAKEQHTLIDAAGVVLARRTGCPSVNVRRDLQVSWRW